MGKIRLILLLLLIVGLGLMAGSVYLGKQCYAFRRAAHEVTAKIVDQKYVSYKVGSKHSKHYPIVQFTIPSGATVKTRLTDTSSNTRYAIGSYMPVLYLQKTGQPMPFRFTSTPGITTTTLWTFRF